MLDITLALLALILLSPVLAVVALAVRFSLGRPVFFRQRRPGLYGVPFTIVKFRTMTDARDAQGKLLPDAQRLTRLGRFLRSTSLDELPELWNVVRGEMSLVGPRPLLLEYLPYYTARERRRHDVLPGLSGLAQVNGRNLLDWNSRLDLDATYSEQLSFVMDVSILIATLHHVLARSGVVNVPGTVLPPLHISRSGD